MIAMRREKQRGAHASLFIMSTGCRFRKRRLAFSTNDILVLYYSHTGAVREMAQLVARGIEGVRARSAARLRTVPKVSSVCEAVEADIPDSGSPYVELGRLHRALAPALGSPTRFGVMGCAAQAFSRWERRPLAQRHAGGQTRSRLHLDREPARRSW